MNTFAIEPIYGSYAVALAIALILIWVILRFTPPIEEKSRKRSLVWLRLTACLVLLLTIFQPTLRYSEDTLTPTTLIVAADSSLSMTLSDGEGKTRSETQRAVWKGLSNELGPLNPNLELKLLLYGKESREIKTPTKDSLDSVETVDQTTNITNAALKAFERSRDKAVTGVILIGDGMQTNFDKSESTQLTLETLRGIGIPLWTIPIGRNAESGPPRDIAIDAVPESLQLFAGNDATLEFQVISKSLAGIEIPLKLSWINDVGEEIVFATRDVVPSQANDVVSVTIPFTVPEAGSYQLKVEAASATNEIVVSNNKQISFVDVREGGGKILYLEGASSMEQVFLRRALRRFPDLDIDFVWTPNEANTDWPIKLNEDFQRGNYDIYIIGDLSSDAVGEAQLARLSEYIASGSGLLTLGGAYAYSSGNYQNTTLAEVLPIVLHANDRSDQASNQMNDPITIVPTQVHPVIDIGGADTDLIATWQNLPTLLGANQWQGKKNLPGVTTLLESQQKNPLMVIGEYGQGRVASIAFDSSWRWWRSGKSEIHRRFWRQTMLWLLSRDNFKDDELVIELDSRRIEVDSPSDFYIASSDPDNQSFIESLQVSVVKPDGSIQKMPTESQSIEGRLLAKGTVQNLEPGIYRLRASNGSNPDNRAISETTFQITENSIELARPESDPDFLGQLANATAAYGGRSYRPEEVGDLCDKIKNDHSRAKTTVTTTLRLGEDPVSGWTMFSIFVMALSLEWTLRRRWGLA